MEMVWIALGGIALIIVVLFLFCACKISKMMGDDKDEKDLD